MQGNTFIFDNLLILFVLQALFFHCRYFILTSKRYYFFLSGIFLVVLLSSLYTIPIFQYLEKTDALVNYYQFSVSSQSGILENIGFSFSNITVIMLWGMQLLAFSGWIVFIYMALSRMYKGLHILVMLSLPLLILPGILFMIPGLHPFVLLFAACVLLFSVNRESHDYRLLSIKSLPFLLLLILASFFHYIFLALLCTFILLGALRFYYEGKRLPLLLSLISPLFLTALYAHFYELSVTSIFVNLKEGADFILPFPLPVQLIIAGIFLYLLVNNEKLNMIKSLIVRTAPIILFLMTLFVFHLLWQGQDYFDSLMVNFLFSFCLVLLFAFFTEGNESWFKILNWKGWAVILIFFLIFPLQWYALFSKAYNYTSLHLPSEKIVLPFMVFPKEILQYEEGLSFEEEILKGYIQREEIEK